MNALTQTFIANARSQNLEWSRQNNGADEPSYGPWSQGKCAVCKRDLDIVYVEKSNERRTYRFHCGHKLVTQSLSAVANCSASLEAASVTADGNEQLVQARRGGFRQEAKAHELSVVKRFTEIVQPQLTKYSKPKKNDKVDEDNPVDIVAESAGGKTKELFQVTRLYERSF